MDILPAQRAVVFGSYILDARRSGEDIAVFNLVFRQRFLKVGMLMTYKGMLAGFRR